jgi:F0F1-type ATP synthase assembly protein I
MRDADGRRQDPPPDDDRASYAKAMDWANRIISASLMMALPALGGFFIDRWLVTAPWFLILGALLGLVVGIWQFYQ